jgi:hypothetical protein
MRSWLFWDSGQRETNHVILCVFFGADEILILCDLWSKWGEKRVCRRTKSAGCRRKTKVALALEGRENTTGGSGHRIGKFSKVEQVTTCMRRKTKLVPSFEKKTKVWHVKGGQARLT